MHHWPLLVAALAGGLIVLAALTWIVLRFPLWAVPAALVLMPIRIPIPTGSGSANLLLPLYVLVLAVLIAEVLVRDRLAPPAGAGRDHLRLALAGFILIAGLSSLWAGLDLVPADKALAATLVKLFAFYLPFAVVYYVVFRYVRTAVELRRLLLTIVWFGAVLAVIGIVQYPTRLVFLNRATILHEQQLGQGFRVNSVFNDPNVFSRFLIMVLLLCLALAVVEPLWRRRLGGIAVLVAVANVFTASRSGWIALAAGLLLFVYAWLGRRKGTYVTVAIVVVGLAGLAVLFEARNTRITWAKFQHPWGINRLTGGRYYLWQAGTDMIRSHPLGGVGLGVFPLAYPAFRDRHADPNLRESHTTPITVLAELGGAGLGLYFIVIFTAFSTALGRGPRTVRPPAAAHAPPEEELPDRRLYLIKAGLAAVVLAMFVDSLLYNDFFEDPYLWTMLALIAAAACRLAVWEVRSATTLTSRNA